jgi:predicted Zn-dependent protease
MPLLPACSRCSASPAGYRTRVSVLSREQFDAIEFDAVRSGDHASAAELMSRLAATAQETAGMPRAEAFLRAGEQYLLADDPAAAAGGFRQAMMDGGPVFVDPRVPLARALFQLGRQPEAQALITRLKAEGPKDPRVCDLVAELLVERGDLPGALGWATTGVELCLSRADAAEAGQDAGGQDGAGPAQPRDGDDASELRLLLSLRYRIRNDLGLPEDPYDQLLDEK